MFFQSRSTRPTRNQTEILIVHPVPEFSMHTHARRHTHALARTHTHTHTNTHEHKHTSNDVKVNASPLDKVACRRPSRRVDSRSCYRWRRFELDNADRRVYLDRFFFADWADELISRYLPSHHESDGRFVEKRRVGKTNSTWTFFRSSTNPITIATTIWRSLWKI